MAIDRIPASLPPAALPSRVGAPASMAPAVQDAAAGALPLAAQDAVAGALTLALAEGLAAALPASSALTQAELQPAMRADQVAMARQLHFAPPDAGAMGSAWRLMARVFGEQQASRGEHQRGQHLPGSRFMAEPAPAVQREAPGPETALWCFPVYAWGRQRMLLSVLSKEPKPAPRAGRRGPAALRLDLFVPGLGHVAVQMEPLGEAVLLELATGEEEALACLRALLPQLSAAIASAGLSVGRCRFGARLGGNPGQAPAPAQFAALPFALFKAMAAVAIVLSRPRGPGGA